MKRLLLVLFLTSCVSGLVSADTETIVPNALEAANGLGTCVIGTIDEDPDASNGDWCVATGNNVSTDVRVSYPDPTDTLTAGADLQEMRCLFRPFDSGQTGDPQIHVDVYESGTAVVTDTTGATMLNTDGDTVRGFTWNATALAAQSGTNVETMCRCVKSGGSPTTRNTCDHGAVEFNADYTVSGGGRRRIIIGMSTESVEMYRRVTWECFNIGQSMSECGVARYN